MAFLFPFFLENRVLRVFLAFHCMPRGDVSLVNYNNKGLHGVVAVLLLRYG